MTTTTLLPPAPTVDVGDIDGAERDRFAHWVDTRQPGYGVPGAIIRAFCGKVWKPLRDPHKYPICPTCDEKVWRLKQAADTARRGS